MKNFLIFASIPLVLFTVFFGLPKMFQVLFNSHTDVGILAILVIVCGICGVVANKLYNFTMKEMNDE